jgi:hypothetical protein
MKKLIGSLFILCSIIACSNKNKLPKDILPQPKMQAIVWDLMSATEFLNGYVFPRDSSIDQTAENQGWYQKVFELHGTTKAEFDKSYVYYKNHPDVMKVLLDSLSRRTYIPDSLKTLKADSLKSPLPDTGNKGGIDTSRRLIPDSLKKKIRRIHEL